MANPTSTTPLAGARMLAVPVGERDHIQGPATAPITLLEYGDYECPFCGMAHPVVKELQHLMGKRMRFAFRNYPLTTVHPHADDAAEAAEAAGGQRKFSPMHDVLLENQQAIDDDDLARYAAELGHNLPRILADLVEHVYLPRVREDFASGVMSGVGGTPTFFINGLRHEGSFDLDTLIGAIEGDLDGPGRRV